jgi:hypothetical protein
VTDLSLRQAQASRAGAQGDDDYDVIGTDGIIIGHIFKATSLRGHSGCGRWLTGITRTERPRTDMRQQGRRPCRHSLRAGTERRERISYGKPRPKVQAPERRISARGGPKSHPPTADPADVRVSSHRRRRSRQRAHRPMRVLSFGSLQAGGIR